MPRAGPSICGAIDNAWRIVAGRYGGLEIDYTAFQGARPSQVVVRGPDLNLALTLSQVELNGDLPRDQLVALKIPDGVAPLSLERVARGRASRPLIMASVTLRAFAKINLSLRVAPGAREGFHDVQTILQAISLCDRRDVRNAPRPL